MNVSARSYRSVCFSTLQRRVRTIPPRDLPPGQRRARQTSERRQPNVETVGITLSQLEAPYQRLVEQEDLRALPLLAYWDAKIAPHTSWWVRQRSVIEGLAICFYINRRCADEPDVLQLLGFPRGVSTEIHHSEDPDVGKACANMPKQ